MNLNFYRLIAVAIQIFGAAEWAVRLPSVLAALATAVWLAFLAARWFGDRMSIILTLVAALIVGLAAVYGLRKLRAPGDASGAS